MKIYIKTLGCPKNFNDSEGVAGICENAGILLTDKLDEADFILVNTCGFINDAKKESIDVICDMSNYIKGSKKEKHLIVSGCLSQRYGDELFEELIEADIFIGVNDYESLPEIIKEFQYGERYKALSDCTRVFEELSARKFEKNPYTATIRVSEGCNNCCAYCAIPIIRGPYRSRKKENILAEAKVLANNGCKELVLIAQDTTEYGKDIYGKLALPELLKDLCKIEGISWIRLMYCYEDKITNELIEVIAEEEKICNYIDIPIQHIANNVLKGMKRRSTTDSIKLTLKSLRAKIPDIHIRTTMIVGFPGESEEDFEELLEFIEETKFERLGVFTYSQEEGTVAGEMSNQIDEDIKNERLGTIMRRQIDISLNTNKEKLGKTMDVLVEERDEEDKTYIGRTQYDAYEIDNNVIFKAKSKLYPGDIVKVKITDAFDYDLVGEMEE